MFKNTNLQLFQTLTALLILISANSHANTKDEQPDTLSSGKLEATETKQGSAKPKSKVEAFEDWALECYEPKINGVACQMIQRVIHDKLKQNILIMSLSYSEERKKDIVQFVLPLDFSLIPGVLIEAGDYKEVLSVNRCSADGCYVEGGIDNKFSEAMKKLKKDTKGRFIIATQQDQKIAIPFSANGFTKAYTTMKNRSK